jgi:hypothetical protein
MEIFFKWDGIKHHEFITEVDTVDMVRYKDVLTSLWEAIGQKQFEMWAIKDEVLLHDSALTH